MMLRMLFSGGFAFLFPFCVMLLQSKPTNGDLEGKKNYLRYGNRILILAVYFIIITSLTVLLRRSSDEASGLNLAPFWSYQKIKQHDVRWQVYMNVFLFIPFGFLLPWAAKRRFLQSFLIGLLFSTCIEAAQYFFHLGLCEFDDVFHNTLGTVIGYGYWVLLVRINQCYGDLLRKRIKKMACSTRMSVVKIYQRVRRIICGRCNK